jgi:acyl-CoA thioester hydrolase
MISTDFTNCLIASEDMKVPFHDIDPAAVVWHGRYFKYFEIVRCMLLEDVDYGYAEMMNSGYVWPVVDTSVRYLKPLQIDQKFTTVAALREWELRLVIDYKILGEDDTLYTKARTVQVPIDLETRELRLGSPDVFVSSVEKRLEALK